MGQLDRNLFYYDIGRRFAAKGRPPVFSESVVYDHVKPKYRELFRLGYQEEKERLEKQFRDRQVTQLELFSELEG